MTGQTTHFSRYGVGFLGVDRHWEFWRSLATNLDSERIGDRRFQWSGVVNETYVFNSPSPHGSDARTAQIFSSDTGQTWWISAQSPIGNENLMGDVIGSEAILEQQSAWRKKSANARFKVVVTAVELEAADYMPYVPFGNECPRGPERLHLRPRHGASHALIRLLM